jgi:hypothetical protein
MHTNMLTKIKAGLSNDIEKLRAYDKKNIKSVFILDTKLAKLQSESNRHRKKLDNVEVGLLKVVKDQPATKKKPYDESMPISKLSQLKPLI